MREAARKAKLEQAKKKQMRTLAVTLGGVGVAAAALIIYIATAGSKAGLVKLKSEGGKYVDKKNGVSYLAADVNYEPAAVGEAYADADGVTLYQIRGLDPKEWLTEKYEGVGAIYYSDQIELPALDGWQANGILVCESDVITIQKAEVKDQSEVDAIVAAATRNPLESEPSELVTDRDNYQVYHLKFTSSVFEGLYYDIIYLDNGKNAYFYDRSTKKYYNAGELLLGYLPRTAVTE